MALLRKGSCSFHVRCILHRHVCPRQQGQNLLYADCSVSLEEDKLKVSPGLSKEVREKKSFI